MNNLFLRGKSWAIRRVLLFWRCKTLLPLPVALAQIHISNPKRMKFQESLVEKLSPYRMKGAHRKNVHTSPSHNEHPNPYERAHEEYENQLVNRIFEKLFFVSQFFTPAQFYENLCRIQSVFTLRTTAIFVGIYFLTHFIASGVSRDLMFQEEWKIYGIILVLRRKSKKIVVVKIIGCEQIGKFLFCASSSSKIKISVVNQQRKSTDYRIIKSRGKRFPQYYKFISLVAQESDQSMNKCLEMWCKRK